MRTNAWIIIERDRALSWLDWLRWFLTDQAEEEPDLTSWEKTAAKRLHDMEYIFKRFLRPTILGKVWIMLSVYDVTPAQIANGYIQLGDAATGGDFASLAYWQWLPGQSFCQFLGLNDWVPAQVLKFMPPTYDEEGDPIPATGVRDVNVLFGQPPREFPL